MQEEEVVETSLEVRETETNQAWLNEVRYDFYKMKGHTFYHKAMNFD